MGGREGEWEGGRVDERESGREGERCGGEGETHSDYSNA